MKKTILLFVAFLLCFSLLACAAADTDPTKVPATKPTQAPTTAPTEPPVPEQCPTCGIHMFEYERTTDGYDAYALTVFHGCEHQTEVVVPSVHEGLPVTHIGKAAFKNAQYLKSVTIPSSVKEIGKEAFYSIETLESVSVSGENLKKIGKSCFFACHSLQEINLPDSVEEIAAEAFVGCSALETINLPASLKEIDSSTFSLCYSLKSIVIPESVTTINSRAFYECENLTTVEMYASMEFIAKQVFVVSNLDESGAPGLQQIIYHGTEQQWNEMWENLSEYHDLLDSFGANRNFTLTFAK